MKKNVRILIISILSFYQLSSQNDDLTVWAKNGSLSKKKFVTEIPFRYVDGSIFVDIKQNDKVYNFLFDTGADMTVIDKSVINDFKYKRYGTTKVSGPLIKSQVTEIIVLDSLKISDINFLNTGVATFDLEFAKKKYCEKVHGILGTTLLKKAVWQIDYENQKIKITDNLSKLDISKSEKVKLKLQKKGWGSESLEIDLDGKVYDFQLDTGFSNGKLVSFPFYYSELIKNKTSKIANYGFSKKDFDYDIIIKNVSLGNINLENQTLWLRKDVGANYKYLGNGFLENYLITIDWNNHTLYLENKTKITDDLLTGFELNFKPNYETNKIEVKNGLKAFCKKNKIKRGAYLVKVNDKNILDLSNDELCEFWNIHWTNIIKKEKIDIVLNQNGKNKEYTLIRKQLSE